MFYSEKEYKSVMTRIAITLLFFAILFPVLTGGISELGKFLVGLFPYSDAVYIISDLSYSLSYLISFVLPVPFFYAISKGNKTHPMLLELKLPEPHPALSYIVIIFAGLAVITPMTYVNSMLFPVPYSESDIFGFEFSQPYKFVLTFISTAIVPAFAEEFLFRGLIVSNLRSYSKSAAVIISAVAFGLMHQNPLQLLYATAAGLVFGIIYVETESIWCCIALHFVNNFIAVLQSYTPYIFDDYTAAIFNFFFVTLIEIIGIVCVIALLVSVKKRNALKKSFNKPSFFGFYEVMPSSTNGNFNFVSIAFKNPAFIIYIIACAAESIALGVLLYLNALGG